jgi:hypothetical protein
MIDLGRPEQSALVVMTQRARRQTDGAGEGSDGQQRLAHGLASLALVEPVRGFAAVLDCSLASSLTPTASGFSPPEGQARGR